MEIEGSWSVCVNPDDYREDDDLTSLVGRWGTDAHILISNPYVIQEIPTLR